MSLSSFFSSLFASPERIAPTDIRNTANPVGDSKETSGASGIVRSNTSTNSNNRFSDDEDDEEEIDGELFEYDQPDLDTRSWQYMAIEPGVFGIQRVTASRDEPIHYLVTTEHRVYKWCIALERETLRTHKRESTRAPVDARTDRPSRIPGVVGAFVASATGHRPVFVFEEVDGKKLLVRDTEIADYGLESTLLPRCEESVRTSNVNLCRYARTGDTSGLTAIDRLVKSNTVNASSSNSSNGSVGVSVVSNSGSVVHTDFKAQSNGIAVNSVSIDLSGNKSKKSCSESADDDGDDDDASVVGEASHDPSTIVDGQFVGRSPVNAREKKQRWVVIGRAYWELYYAYESMLYRTGCYLLHQRDRGVVLDADAERAVKSAGVERTLTYNLELQVRRLAEPALDEGDRRRILGEALIVEKQLRELREQRALKK